MAKTNSAFPQGRLEEGITSAPEQRQRRDIGRRLVQVRLPDTQEEYAQRLNIHVNTLARYERGERLPAADFLRRLASHGVDLHWLLTGTAQPAAAGAVAELQPVHGVQSFASLRAARHGPAAPRAEEWLGDTASVFFDEQWLQQHWGITSADTCMVQICGDSMLPVLRTGDLVLVDRRCNQCEADGLYLLRMNQQLVVRRVRAEQGSGEIRAADPRLPEYRFVTEEMRTAATTAAVFRCHEVAGSDMPCWVSVLGRVLWVGQSL